jgi:hypothetical protein
MTTAEPQTFIRDIAMDKNATTLHHGNKAMQEYCREIGMIDNSLLRLVKVYYVENGKLYVGIVNGEICDICKAHPRSKISPRAIIVETLDATFEAIHHADGRLYLDGFALIYLWTWLYHEMPKASFMA